MSQHLAIDTEQAEVALVVVDHAVALSGRVDEAGPHAWLRSRQGPQQVPVHGVDEAWSLSAAADDQAQLGTHTGARHLAVMARQDGSWGHKLCAGALSNTAVLAIPVPEQQCGISGARQHVAVPPNVGLRPGQARHHIPVAKHDLG